MPYTKEGITPDIIINPHAIPSRMTIGQLLEQLLGKKSCLVGQFQNGTPFTKINLEEEFEKFKQFGYNEYGNEFLYCPDTGRRMKNPVFMGIAYYMKLQHLSQDKLHVRKKGPRHYLTKQPVQGRRNDGGQRAGEMERFCMESQGCAGWTHEMIIRSDMDTKYFCTVCGLPGNFDFRKHDF